MAKVTVYVTDEQLEKLKRTKRHGRSVSKAFQAFLDEVQAGSGSGSRYDYARSLMPLSDQIERARRRLAAKVQAGGPPADGGPVSLALAVLVYRRLVADRPELEEQLLKEFGRFGLDDLVAAEADSGDLLAEPEEADEDDGADEDDDEDLGDFGRLGQRIGSEVREALRHSLGGIPMPPPAPGAPPPPGGWGARGGRSSRIEVHVSEDDDPREVLTVAEFERFTRQHGDWDAGQPLSADQQRTLGRLLGERAESQLRDRRRPEGE